MTDVPDDRLLEQFARNGSEEAFAALVQRHIALVHSVALRHTANAEHAQDITQAVFIILARKARALGCKTVLPGWLYHTARLTAANLQRAEARRIRREQEVFMQSNLEESTTDALWRELSPQLDEAMAGLGTNERDALVLRYFQNKSMAQVGQFLGLEENTAQKRVSRALEKLRKFFTKRGVDSTLVGIADTISTHSIQAVPVALAKSVTAVAIAKGATASISTLTLIKGALKIMAWTKAKMAIVIGAGILLAAGTTTVIVERAIPPTPTAIFEAIFEHPTSQSMNLLESAPPTLIFRATQFPQKIGRGSPWTPSGKFVAVNFPLDTSFGIAYGFRQDYVVFPDDINLGNTNYDILITLPSHQKEALREELKKRFGLTAHSETRAADVLLLKIADPTKLQLYKTKGGGYRAYGDQKRIFRNAGLAVVADTVEVGKPVLDGTGTKEHYDFNFQWTEQKWLWAEQLNKVGLELVPTNMPIEMLVVEKAK